MHFTPDSSGTKLTGKTPSAEAAPYRSRLPQAAAPPLTLVHACRYRCTTFSKIARLPATVAANDRLPRRPAQNRSCSTAAIRTASPILCSAAAAQKKSPLTTSLVVSTPRSRAPFRLAGRRAGVAVSGHFVWRAGSGAPALCSAGGHLPLKLLPEAVAAPGRKQRRPQMSFQPGLSAAVLPRAGY
jgi:hypothetical protein